MTSVMVTETKSLQQSSFSFSSSGDSANALPGAM
jgi:hypothetical protein